MAPASVRLKIPRSELEEEREKRRREEERAGGGESRRGERGLCNDSSSCLERAAAAVCVDTRMVEEQRACSGTGCLVLCGIVGTDGDRDGGSTRAAGER